MDPLMERAASLKEQVASQRTTSSACPHGLTPREAEVLQLIAIGKGNQDIADELIISINTVARHASNIFAKIGVTNRTEAAAYAARNGLVSWPPT